MFKQKFDIPTEVYLKLYDLLEDKIRKSLGGSAKAIPSKELWSIFNKSKAYGDLFKGGKCKHNYFYRKLEQIGSKPDNLLSMDSEVFCDALVFLGFETDFANSIFSYRSLFEKISRKFLDKYFSGKHEYYKIILEGKIPDNKKRMDVRNKENSKEYLELDGKIFISEIRQGRVIDKAVLTLNITGDKKVEGVMDVLYVNEKTKHYNKQTYPLLIRGEFLFNKVLMFLYENPGIEHAGVFKLEYATNKDVFTGSYIAFFESMHPDRVSRVGHVCFVESTKSDAKAFLNASKGQAMVKKQNSVYVPKPENKNVGQKLPSIPDRKTTKQ